MKIVISELMTERLAEIEHDRWAHWQKYLHGMGVRNIDGSMTLPANLVEKWTRLIETPYSNLSEDERKSDREQVKRYLPELRNILAQSLAQESDDS